VVEMIKGVLESIRGVIGPIRAPRHDPDRTRDSDPVGLATFVASNRGRREIAPSHRVWSDRLGARAGDAITGGTPWLARREFSRATPARALRSAPARSILWLRSTIVDPPHALSEERRPEKRVEPARPEELARKSTPKGRRRSLGNAVRRDRAGPGERQTRRCHATSRGDRGTVRA